MPSSYALNLGLNDAPNPDIDPEVWAELNKVFLALRSMADAMDSGVNPNLLGTPGEAVTLQNYSKVYTYARDTDIPAGKIVTIHAGSSPGATLCGSTYPIASAYAEKDVAHGDIGEFITFGMVWYPPSNLIPGSRYYVDTSTASNGNLTTTTTGKFVGQAFDAKSLFFYPRAF